MRLVVFKHSSGGAAKLLVDQWEVLEFLAQRVHFNLTGHLVRQGVTPWVTLGDNRAGTGVCLQGSSVAPHQTCIWLHDAGLLCLGVRLSCATVGGLYVRGNQRHC
jgi:hypothetical protein